MYIADHCWCGGTYREGRVIVTFRHDDEPELVLEDVLRSQCDRCGRQVYAPAELERLEAAVRNEPVVITG